MRVPLLSHAAFFCPGIYTTRDADKVPLSLLHAGRVGAVTATP